MSVLNSFNSLFYLLLGVVMALLTRPIQIQERRADPMVGNLERSFPHIGHMAISTRYSRLAVRALIPDLEFWMLRFQYFGTRFSVLPIVESVAILELVAVVVRLDFFDL